MFINYYQLAHHYEVRITYPDDISGIYVLNNEQSRMFREILYNKTIPDDGDKIAQYGFIDIMNLDNEGNIVQCIRLRNSIRFDSSVNREYIADFVISNHSTRDDRESFSSVKDRVWWYSWPYTVRVISRK